MLSELLREIRDCTHWRAAAGPGPALTFMRPTAVQGASRFQLLKLHTQGRDDGRKDSGLHPVPHPEVASVEAVDPQQELDLTLVKTHRHRKFYKSETAAALRRIPTLSQDDTLKGRCAIQKPAPQNKQHLNTITI